jgi:glycogen debranching enzyme
VGSLAVFDLELAANEAWECCVVFEPQIDDVRLSFLGDAHADEEPSPVRVTVRADPVVQLAFERGSQDLCALALPGRDGQRFVGAGVPWFLTLFGRDALMTALLVGVLGSWPAEGGLDAVSGWQAVARDDWRDAEPGKFPHELRRGELAHDHRIPHTPYYGTHDAQALFCLALWQVWRWSGRTELLEGHLDAALRAMSWCDEQGDRDGDGLQEYGTRSRAGYYNQSWKDAGDAIVHEDGSLAELPIATVELQAYLYAARLAMAELMDVRGDTGLAVRFREGAARLRALVERHFWLEDLGTYAMALDGHKVPVLSASSNPGHLLWCGVVSPERASTVTQRLLRPDLFSGWGIRTLSAEHAAYNPLSYQRGSVWPHDTLLAAAGMWRYGLREEACIVLRAVFEAADAFEGSRLPELFCGFDRSVGPPVPYIEANLPQAWAAAVPVAGVQLLLGLVPDAPRHRCYLAPWLPAWLPSLEVHGLTVGDGQLDVRVVRRGETTEIAYVTSSDIDIVTTTRPAPLWGPPLP